jgi:regulator of RNase E activity RraA
LLTLLHTLPYVVYKGFAHRLDINLAVDNYAQKPPSAAEIKAAEFPRPDAQTLRRLRKLPVANIGDVMDRLGILDSKISPIWPGARIVGPAFTVWTRSGDNDAIHKALAVAKAGDVIIVNGGGDESRALIGDIMGLRAKHKKLAGFVLDGAARDATGLAEMGLPVFARALTPAGPYKFGPGKIGITIAVGGVACAPGDLVVGDDDGVIVIPRLDVQRIMTEAEEVLASESKKKADAKKGR